MPHDVVKKKEKKSEYKMRHVWGLRLRGDTYCDSVCFNVLSVAIGPESIDFSTGVYRSRMILKWSLILNLGETGVSSLSRCGPSSP